MKYLVTILQKQYYDIEVEAESEAEAFSKGWEVPQEELEKVKPDYDTEVYVDPYIQYRLKEKAA